jgi:EF hand
MDMSDYAKSLVKQHDKNGDMMLDEAERRELRGPAASADLNDDGTITIDEIVARLSNRGLPSATRGTEDRGARRSETESAERAAPERRSLFGSGRGERRDRASGDESRGSGEAATSHRVLRGTAWGAGADGEAKDQRRSYRFTPAAEKLPSGLPGWFKSRDANGDGQVAMSEYARSWSARLVAEFRRYDTNDDGIITAKEAGGS